MAHGPARTTDVAALLLQCSDQFVLRPARDAHVAIARRAFAPLRPLGGSAAERVHEQFLLTSYAAASGALSRSGDSARALSRRGVGRRIEQHRIGRRLRAVVNGMAGAQLRTLDDPHALTMALRSNGQDVPPTRWALQQAFPDASGHLVLFVHGLCADDEAWQLDAQHRPTYLDQVTERCGATAIAIRYNSGLPVGENGQHLADLLSHLVEHWPTRVTRVTLVGHAMGAVVARAATQLGVAARKPWVGLVRDVICLGSPQTGTPGEKLALATAALTATAPAIRRLPGQLSSGQQHRDWPQAAVVSRQDRGDVTITAAWGRQHAALAPLPWATFRFVAAGSSGDERALLNHSQVGEWLVDWLNERNAAPRALPTR